MHFVLLVSTIHTSCREALIDLSISVLQLACENQLEIRAEMLQPLSRFVPELSLFVWHGKFPRTTTVRPLLGYNQKKKKSVSWRS